MRCRVSRRYFSFVGCHSVEIFALPPAHCLAFYVAFSVQTGKRQNSLVFFSLYFDNFLHSSVQIVVIVRSSL